MPPSEGKECLNKRKDRQLWLHKNVKCSSVKKKKPNEKSYVKWVKKCTAITSDKKLKSFLYKELLWIGCRNNRHDQTIYNMGPSAALHTWKKMLSSLVLRKCKNVNFLNRIFLFVCLINPVGFFFFKENQKHQHHHQTRNIPQCWQVCGSYHHSHTLLVEMSFEGSLGN